MAEKQFNLEIITPEKVVYSANVEHVKAPGKNGYFGVKVNHIPFLTVLKIGKIEIEAGKQSKVYATSGGFVEVANNKMTILAETAEEAGSIDVERAQQARHRAGKRLEEKKQETNMARAKASLMRALNRLEVAAKR